MLPPVMVVDDVDVMRDVLGGGRIIAVDLRRKVELTMQAVVGPALSGWQVLVRRARRVPEPFDPPGIAAILARSVELAGLLHPTPAVGGEPREAALPLR